MKRKTGYNNYAFVASTGRQSFIQGINRLHL